MQRRSFLKNATLGAGAGALAVAPALAQAQPAITWRLASSFPKTLDTIYASAEHFCKRVAELTGGKFTIRQHAAGEIVPGLQVMDAVQAGTVEMGHTPSYYYFGKDPAFCFDCAVPFGLTSRQQTAWYDQGGGRELMREFYKGYGIINFMAGNTGTQMGGWYRKEVKTVADMKGLKIRIAGFAGRVMERMGAVPQQIPASDVYGSLEKGTIDAAEWVGPYDDEKLGFFKVAKHYYYPGWWEPGPELDLLVGNKAWESLPKEYKAVLDTACAEAYTWMVSKYDALNPPALKRLIGNGVELKPFSDQIMAAFYKTSKEVYDEIAAKNPKFKKIYDPWNKFREDQVQWFSIAEGREDNFMAAVERMAQRSAPKKR
jgi:TRAP-type mannitol/chloroaromatic compound transport system substrate-binding protein